ncbi:dihydrodipicolinate synthase family protein [Sporosarcina sp. FA9]|uniref:dihydrodipicolinate synthase family protein n=1 Tax=Sporosarcina sp. FA9 TaxID=3413030 RepID=UPI003F65BAA2
MSLSIEKLQLLHDGAFIPAHPLALLEDKSLDEESQRQLTQYYLNAGVDGLAVGVHTTQFEIRDPKFNLYERVLQLAKEEVQNTVLKKTILMVAGVCGPTDQAIEEAILAKKIGYDMVLLSNGGLNHYTESDLLERTRKIANILPVFGFYLQPAVGGRAFSYEFWKDFANIDNVLAIKMAPFNRYQTLDVVRAVCESNRTDEIALYTGNDDNIVLDLFTNYEFKKNGETCEKEIVGGLLGHWSVWTESAVKMFEDIKLARKEEKIDKKWLTIAQKVTDSNAAFFDSANQFKGSISGINEVLRRQGLLRGNWCLAENEVLSEGQAEEITRVEQEYPELNDIEFILEFLLSKNHV